MSNRLNKLRTFTKTFLAEVVYFVVSFYPKVYKSFHFLHYHITTTNMSMIMNDINASDAKITARAITLTAYLNQSFFICQ